MKPLGLKTDCTFSSTDNPPDYEEHACYGNWFCYDVVTDGRMDQLTDRPMEGWTNGLNKADRHKSRAPSNQFPTDQPTDRPTDRVAYRVACTRLKSRAFPKEIPI